MILFKVCGLTFVEKGCQFYLGKAWWLKIQYLGIVLQYSNYDYIKPYLMHIFGLSFLNSVKEGYIFLIKLAAVQPLYDEIIKLLDYLVDT